jgi:CheY-like chemotaxis protein
MHGHVSVESELGQGTTFALDFQLGASDEDTGRSNMSDAGISGHTILIVDDNAVNRRILEEQARSWGVLPVCVEGGAQALSLLASGATFSLAILDYQMPGMNGFELARALKATAQSRDLPLLLLTSVGQLGDLDEEIAGNFEAMIVKPARTGQLADKVRKIIGRAQAQVAVHPAADTRLPAEAATPAPAEIPVAEPLVQDNVPSGDKLRILVAEDNEVNRKVIAAMLADGGYDIHFAVDGVQAVEAYRQVRPDIVLMDISMPNLDGLSATSQIRTLEKISRRHARVIGLTAHAMPEDRQACLDSGMDDYLPKPINRSTLMALMKKTG